MLFSNWWWWCYTRAIITNAAAIYVRPKPPTVYTHSYKSYVTSAYWAHKFKVHNRNMKRGGKVVKQVVRKPAITNPVGPHGLCFIS